MNIQNCRPIKKTLLIQAYEIKQKTEGGIFIPDIVRYSRTRGGSDPWRGKVIAVGPEVKQVSVGEIVRYQPNNYYKNTIEEEGTRYIFLDELLVYAVENEEEKLTRALKGRIVFLPDKLMEEKYGLIYLPQKREEKLLYGTIEVAGLYSDVGAGDRVIIENRSTWQYFDSKGKRYILTDRFNLLAKVYSYCECLHPTSHSAGTMRNGMDLLICQECGGVVKV